MESKIAFGLVILCVIPLGLAIQCYKCTDEASCRSPSLVTCTSVQATQTIYFLDDYFQNVSTAISTQFDCMRMNLNISTTSMYYKGCIYYNINSCGYTLMPNFTTGYSSKECYQCNNFNGCNPADRSYVSVAVLVLPLICALKYIMQ